MSTYTEADLKAAVDAAVAEAVGPIKTERDNLLASHEAGEIEKRVQTAVEEAVTPLQAEVEELKTKLDAAVLEAANQKARGDALEAEKTAAAEAAEAAARQEERITKIKEVASFPDEYLTANAERWAGMSEEDFAARLEEYRQIAAQAPASDGLPNTTVLTAATEDSTNRGQTSALKELASLQRSGIDPRTISNTI